MADPPHVGHAARAPVRAAAALRQLLVDQEPAERGEIRMAARDDPVHIRFRVEACGLEVLNQPAQHRKPLLALDRNADELAPHVDEVFEHAEVAGGNFCHRLATMKLRQQPAPRAAAARASDQLNAAGGAE